MRGIARIQPGWGITCGTGNKILRQSIIVAGYPDNLLR